ALGDLIVAPAVFHLVLHLVERALIRGRVSGDFEPDKAVIVGDLQRIIVDPDIGGEGGGDDIDALRKINHRTAIRGAAGAVDGIDRANTKPELFRRFGDIGAARAFVLDLVAQVADLDLGLCRRDLSLDFLRDVLIRTNLR